MPYTANRQFKANPRLLVSARDMHYVAADGRGSSTVRPAYGAATPVMHGRGLSKLCRSRSSNSTMRQLSDGASEGLRTVVPPRATCASRPRPCLFHQLRFRGCRHGDEDCDRLSSGARRGLPLSRDRPGAWISWLGVRRRVGGRHRIESQDVWPFAGRRGSHPAHARPGAKRFLARGSRTWRRVRRRPGARDRATRRLDDRRGDRRAGRRIDGSACPATGISGMEFGQFATGTAYF